MSEMSDMAIQVQFTDGRSHQTMPNGMAKLAGRTFPVSERVPGAVGEGFDLLEWAQAAMQASGRTLPEPTHLIVRAADEFEAVIPWSQLSQALFQFAHSGEPLVKGGPLRLYVPDGSSACLNVKSVVSIRIAHEPERGEQAAYGFRNEVNPAQLVKGLKFST